MTFAAMKKESVRMLDSMSEAQVADAFNYMKRVAGISVPQTLSQAQVAALDDLCGMWADMDSVSPDGMVRNLRKGRNFDI